MASCLALTAPSSEMPMRLSNTDAMECCLLDCLRVLIVKLDVETDELEVVREGIVEVLTANNGVVDVIVMDKEVVGRFNEVTGKDEAGRDSLVDIEELEVTGTDATAGEVGAQDKGEGIGVEGVKVADGVGTEEPVVTTKDVDEGLDTVDDGFNVDNVELNGAVDERLVMAELDDENEADETGSVAKGETCDATAANSAKLMIGVGLFVPQLTESSEVLIS